MAPFPNQHQQGIGKARGFDHHMRRNQRKKERRIAKRMATGILRTPPFSLLLAAFPYSALSLPSIADVSATDPSYKRGAAQAEILMFIRRKQLRRWFHDLIERRDPGRPKSGHDVRAFNTLTKLRTDEELIEQLKGDAISPLVKDLFDKVFRERAKAAGVHDGGNMEVDVEDWWGPGPEMERPGELVGGEGISNVNGGEGEGGEEGGESMDSKEHGQPKKLELQLPFRIK